MSIVALTSSHCSLRISSSFSFSCCSKASSLLGSWGTRRHRVRHFLFRDSVGGQGRTAVINQPDLPPSPKKWYAPPERGASVCQRGVRTCNYFDCPHKCLCVFASTLCAPMSAARRGFARDKVVRRPDAGRQSHRLARRGSGSAEGRGTLARPCAVRGYYYREDGAEQWRQETDDGGE